MQQLPTSTSTIFITVVSQPDCVQCKATYRSLTKAGLAYLVITDDTHPDHLLAMSLGHQQAPVVLVRDAAGTLLDHWSGFRPDKISELVKIPVPA